MSVQIDPVHIPLRFFAVQQMQEVRTQGMVTPQAALEASQLQLSDYRSSQVQDTPRSESHTIQDQQRRRGHNGYHRRREGERVRFLRHRTAADPDAEHIVNVQL